MAYFPMFIDLNRKPVLLAGGGRVALRKAGTLLDFGAEVTVCAKTVCPELKILAEEGRETGCLILKEDCSPLIELTASKYILLVAATDDHSLNHELALKAKELGLPVNAVDQPEDCSFIFPSYCRQGDLVAAFSSGGKSPVMAQYLKEEEAKILTPRLGEINDSLGAVRDQVKALYPTEEERKAVYRAILEEALKEA